MMNCECFDPTSRLQQLNQRASDFMCDHKIPVIRYLRSSKEMERMASVYAEENEYENCFLLYMKLITLLVEKLPKHPQYKTANPEEKKIANKRCKNAIQAAEKVKLLLKGQYEKEYTKWLLEEEQKKKEAELRRIELKRQEEEEAKLASIKNEGKNISTSSQVPNNLSAAAPPLASLSTAINNNQNFSLPSVPSVSGHNSHPSAPPPDAYAPPPLSSFTPPPHDLPPYSPSTQFPPYQPPAYEEVSSPPGVGGGVPTFDRTSKPVQFSRPGVDRSTKPEDHVACDSSLDGNRRVVISPDLCPKFLQLAQSNTLKNLETCGILTGKLSRNSFRITHLVIPKQKATSDSCTTESEEDLFEVQDKYDLITLGWIHTHPSQTSFLSSVDLHTQCSYQQLMPEAIAIVCSPKYNTTGMFRLTPSYGVNFISSCTKGGFHPHPKEPPLYEESPLVSVDNSFKIEVIDLR